MDTRMCLGCRTLKPLSGFSQSRQKTGKCKVCIQEYNTSRWRNHRDKYIAMYKGYYRMDPDKQKEKSIRWGERNPHKIASRRAVARALKTGDLVRLPCEKCGKLKVDAHHDSYLPEHRLTVRWFCRFHHKEHHRLNPHL